MILVLSFLGSCTQRTADKQVQENETSTSKKTTKEEDASKDDSEHKEGKLELNNGKKWKMDDSTRLNMSALKQIVTAGEEKTYLLKSVRAQTDKLVRECRMQGPDHDALHVWLTEFLKHLKEAETGKEGLAELKEDVDEFYNYFE